MQPLRLIRGTAVPTDEEIKQVALVDRRRAASLVADKYGDRLFQHATYVLKNPTEATDVVQEVFIKAMREKRFFNDDFKMKAWLFRVTSNLCFNIRRDTRRRSAILDSAKRPQHFEACQDAIVHGNQRQRAIFNALEKVSEDHREILIHRYYNDLSYAEIAQTLDLKLGTVMSRLSRAKRALLEALRASGVDPVMD